MLLRSERRGCGCLMFGWGWLVWEGIGNCDRRESSWSRRLKYSGGVRGAGLKEVRWVGWGVVGRSWKGEEGLKRCVEMLYENSRNFEKFSRKVENVSRNVERMFLRCTFL